MSLRVNEIFYSIQGESSYAGNPCVFVRLTGCNLRCSYCDTRYAYDEGEELEVSQILERVKVLHCNLVEVTGGEPLLQEDTPSLITRLVKDGFAVLLETNGSIDISRVDPHCVRIVDVKSPSSGEADHFDFGNLSRLSTRDELKFVVADRRDYDYAKQILQKMDDQSVSVGHVHFSPVFGAITPEQLATCILEDHLSVRLNLQLHKIIWDPDRRGV